MGASCAGSTTLGQALAERLGIPCFDTDTCFWVATDPPYTTKRDPDLRNQMMKDDLAKQESWILTGSVIKYGEEWPNMFDVAVFLYIPGDLRMQRLIAREVERYGDIIYRDAIRNQQHLDFVAWAAKYDDITFTGRNVKAHEDWLKMVNAKVLEIRGDITVDERVERVVEFINGGLAN